ncbi:hypothetical protein CAI21_04580 [Alkalilimnicola ehrlichii]|uniref:Uncharacterized protein n=1 Tax=Alkalilimnicola ehrlichii TaxID=351052 RepID=A0A3E0WZT5_9GAMM|nr:hypothetical protein [Alkalilimnicola ehrlichii]RFA30786.1 hypothetical protein CAI21_04580 [Alkalilimnicola ehrlichii]RFA38364.1 hypothetical protein CAL65_05950 [Alkalilimnicola ehrlichii]
MRKELPSAFSRRLLGILLLAFLLPGCAMLSDRGVSLAELEAAGADAVRYDRSFAYGHGTGDTREAAHQAAREQLAGELLTQVRSEMRTLERELQVEESGETRRQYQREFSSSSIAAVNVELEGIQVDEEQRGQGGWYVRLRVPNDMMDELRRRARRNAPALARVEATEAAADTAPGRQLRSALRGLAVVYDRNLADAGVFAGDRRTTFEAFFLDAITDGVDRIRVLPLVQGERVRFLAIERNTFTPQPGLMLGIGGQELETNSEGVTGWVAINDLPARIDISVLGYSQKNASDEWHHPNAALLRSDSIDRDSLTESRRAQVFVHTEPAGAVVVLNEHEVLSPGVIALSSGARYRVIAQHGADYDRREEVISIPQGAPYAFVSLELRERRFGFIDVNATGRQSEVRVRSLARDDEYRPESNRFARELDVGRYEIRVSRGDDEDYEQILDHVTLLEGMEFQRAYSAPRYREPFHHGWRFAINVGRFGGEPESDYRLPWADGERIAYTDLEARTGASDVDFNGNNVLLTVHRLFDRFNFTLQGKVGAANHEITLTQNGRGTDFKLDSWYASAGAGFWYSFGNDRLISALTYNQGLEHTSWDTDTTVRFRDAQGNWQSLSSSSVSNRYGYIELSNHLDLSPVLENFGLTFSAVVPSEKFEPYVHIGIGWAFMTRGHRHPATVRAREGTHY